MQMMRIQRYDQCGEYIDGFDVQVKCNSNTLCLKINASFERRELSLAVRLTSALTAMTT